MAKSKTSSTMAVVGLAVVTVFAATAIAQQSQSANSQGVPQRIDLSTLQRTGPGGDLENTLQATTQGAVASCPQETCSECLFLDSYNPNNTFDPNVPGSEVINTVQTVNALTSGQPYLLTIKGTVSYWGFSYYTAPIGNPALHPIYYSPAVPVGDQGDVSSDWEYLFAYPNNSHGNLFASGPVHIVFDGISLDNGATFVDLVPLGGQVYSSGHSYQYLIEGQGLQARFRVSDFGPHSDNYGVFKICIQKLNPCGSISDNTSTACVDTQGYWGSKPNVTWPAPYSRTATFFLSGQTWQQVLDSSVSASPGYYQLADQYIAAVLNQANGAPVPSGVMDTLNLANTWFGANGPSACTAAGSCGDQKSWASTLDSYNSGTYPGGPSHCS